MDAMVDFLIQYGYWGMFLAAFLAASVFPFSSEAVMVGLQLAGLDPLLLLVWGTIGNVGGSMFNYSIGRLGRMEWVEKYLRVKRESVEKAQHWMERKGAWVGGILCVVPVIGDAISVALGFMRANWLICLISITIGKLVRYVPSCFTSWHVFAFSPDANRPAVQTTKARSDRLLPYLSNRCVTLQNALQATDSTWKHSYRKAAAPRLTSRLPNR